MIVNLAEQLPYVDGISKKFGDDWTLSGLLGLGKLGLFTLGRVVTLDPTFGIYRARTIKGKCQTQRTVFYRPSQPRTTDQQANRTKFRDAVAAWQALDETDKNDWRRSARSVHYSGYNLYLKRYMLSH